jgi:inner membrane protein
MALFSGERSPSAKLALAILVGLLLAIPLFTVWLLVYDRQSQSETARASIAAGWGGPQTLAGPILVIPYQAEVSETVTEANQQVTRSRRIWRELALSPFAANLQTSIRPESRQRSIYEAVVYEAALSGNARFALPADLGRFGVALEDLALDRAELRFGLSDPRGLFGSPPQVSIGGNRLGLQPGGGTPATNGAGFFSWVDARPLLARSIESKFAFSFRGNGWLSMQPSAGDTRWVVRSPWPHPSFQGGFLPVTRTISPEGFAAVYRVGNLALGRSLVNTGDASSRPPPSEQRAMFAGGPVGDYEARIDLVQPVDLYDRVSRSAKYGFLFIGFTFLAFLLFDVIGGVRVSPAEYLLVGAGLVLFFVLLLALAEVLGFMPAYLVASLAIIGLNTAYAAAVLKSWARAAYIGALLAGLYVVLYILLSLEAFSLLIGSLLLFVALAAVMYLTRNLDWAARRGAPADHAPG